jgi:predicted O-methyltransferase YrrM
MLEAASWAFISREDTNFTYPVTDRCLKYLAHAVSTATGTTPEEAGSYIEEAQNDERLKSNVVEAIKNGPYRSYADPRCDFGRRLGWYAFARILRPNIIVETGVDKGFGSVLLCAALLRNGSGRFIGTDINPNAGYLIQSPYSSVSTILYGDSIKSLRRLTHTIDLFINDSDHSANYELLEYQTIQGKLSTKAIVLGDNAHATTKLMEWSQETGRQFLFWREEPVQHWYPGGGIGISFNLGANSSDNRI